MTMSWSSPRSEMRLPDRAWQQRPESRGTPSTWCLPMYCMLQDEFGAYFLYSFDNSGLIDYFATSCWCLFGVSTDSTRA